MVPAARDLDSSYDRKVKAAIDSQDANALLYEEREMARIRNQVDPVKEVGRFLNDALATHDSKEMLRKANFLSNRKQGRRGDYGYVLEEVFRSQGATRSADGELGSLSAEQRLQLSSSISVLERSDVKARSMRERMVHEKKNTKHKASDGAAGEDESVQGSVPVKNETKQ